MTTSIRDLNYQYNMNRIKNSVALFFITAMTTIASANVLVTRESWTYPDSPEKNTLTEYEYTPEGFISKVTSTVGHENPEVRYTSFVGYSDINNSASTWGLQTIKSVSPDWESKTITKREYDGQNRVIKKYLFSGENLCNVEIMTFRYDDDGKAYVSECEQWECTVTESPFSFTLDRQIYTYGYVWCDGLGIYRRTSSSPSSEIKVYPDREESTEWTDETRSQIKSKSISYYADGKKTANLSASLIKDSQTQQESLYWIGYKTEVNVNTQTGEKETIDYSVDSKTGEFVYKYRVVETPDLGKPGHDSWKLSYHWDASAEEWRLNNDIWNSIKYKWDASKRILESYNAATDELINQNIYDTGMNLIGTMNWVSESLYYIRDIDRTNGVETLTYYTSGNAYTRKIRMDFNKFYFYPEVRELRGSEWVAPTQPFIIKHYNHYDHVGIATNPYTEMGWDVAANRPSYEQDFSYDENNNRRNLSRRTYSSEGYTNINYPSVGSMYTKEICKITWLNDHIIAQTYSMEQSDSRKWGPYYTEYETDRKLVHSYNYDEATKTHLYNETSSLMAISYTDDEGKEHSSKITYDRATDALSGTMSVTSQEKDADNAVTKKEIKNYALDITDMTWKLASEEVQIYTVCPDWKKYKFSEGYYLAYNFMPTYLAGNDFIYQHPETEPASVKRENNKTVLTYDPATGELINTTSHTIGYTIEPQVNERRVVDIDNGEETTTFERYEMNSDGYLTVVLTDKMTDGHHYYYNENNHLVRAVMDNGTTPDYNAATRAADSYPIYQASYLNESSEEKDDSGVRNIIASSSSCDIMAEGRYVYSVSGQTLSVYTADGRLISDGVSDSVELPDAGIYLIRTATGTRKIVVR